MKRLWLLLLPLAWLLASCSKDDVQRPPIDEGAWLNKERGFVVASDFQCDYFIVETQRGYALMRNWGGFSPFRGAVLYGEFSRFGVQTFYNRSDGTLMNADIRDITFSYFQAIDQLNWYCGQGTGFDKAIDSTTAGQN
jgi:hypothetical protein